jgi:hypothetical protein
MTEQVQQLIAAYDALGLRKLPTLEFTFAWLNANAPREGDKADAWSSVLNSARGVVERAAQGASFRAGKASVDSGLLARRVSEAEMQCLVGIADVSAGGAKAVIEDKKDAPKKKTKACG